MGVDIYGRKPIVKSERPEQIDYQVSTEDEKQKHIPVQGVFGMIH